MGRVALEGGLEAQDRNLEAGCIGRAAQRGDQGAWAQVRQSASDDLAYMLEAKRSESSMLVAWGQKQVSLGADWGLADYGSGWGACWRLAGKESGSLLASREAGAQLKFSGY